MSISYKTSNQRLIGNSQLCGIKSAVALPCLALTLILALTGCDSADTSNPINQGDPSTPQSSKDAQSNQIVADNDHMNANEMDEYLADDGISTSSHENDRQKPIDWTKIDSGVTPVDRKNYPYSFGKDSSPVQSYADYFGVDVATAQHNLTIGMASNEPLSKLLDQLGSAYQSHELTDGEKMTLIIYTTDAIAPSSYDYVIADKIGHGLILPVRVVNKKVATETVD